MESKVLFPGVKDGEVFRVGDIDFIKFPSEGGKNLRSPTVPGKTTFPMGTAEVWQETWTGQSVKF